MGLSTLPELTFELSTAAPMGARATEELHRYLGTLLAAGYPPSVSLGVVAGPSVVLEAYGGWACTVGQAQATTARTVYDLASLTKVVCTVPLVMLARERGALDLDDPVRRWLPAYPVAGTTLRHLLAHTSGLVDHRAFFAVSEGREAIEAAVYREAAASRRGGQVVYSDLNFMLLGWALEACSGTGLDELFARDVAAPLGLTGTRFRPPPEEQALCAATELDGDQRLGPGLVWGQVHDGNAFALGGVAGHAGLFAPLSDLCRFAQAHFRHGAGRAGNEGRAGLLSEPSLALLATRQAATGDDVRGIGWRLGPPPAWGNWPEGTLWHTGFTGTSMLISPRSSIAVVLLTNAVHPHRNLPEQALVRAEVHHLLAEALA